MFYFGEAGKKRRGGGGVSVLEIVFSSEGAGNDGAAVSFPLFKRHVFFRGGWKRRGGGKFSISKDMFYSERADGAAVRFPF